MSFYDPVKGDAMTCFLALDQGTSSSRALVFDELGRIRAIARRDLAVAYPHPGWVEQDASEIWTTQRDAAEAVLADAAVEPHDIVAVGLANQRETTVIWDRSTGQPIAPAIVWQDRRTTAACSSLAASENLETIKHKTGLPLEPYFSATKIGWILDHVDGARVKSKRGELAFGTVDSWLIWNLTGGQVHATDVTNASRTLLFNIHTLDWDDEQLRLFNIPRTLMPTVKPCAGRYGTTTLGDTTLDITGVGGDQPAALLGQHCWQPGEVKNTYGTGAFVLMHTGTEPVDSDELITGPVCSLPHEPRAYGLEGAIYVAGALIQWLRDELGLIKAAADVETLARQVPDTGGAMIVPAFAGLGAPFWDATARGTIVGLTRGTTAAHLARASLEALALRTRDVVDVMQTSVNKPMATLRVDGGAAANDLLLQIQADLLGLPIIRPATTETTAIGAAMLAATGSGALDSNAIKQWQQLDDQFVPQLAANAREQRYHQWRRACRRARHWAIDDS